MIADANSLAYVLHTPVGDDFVIDDNGRPLRLRVVAALRDSVLQGEFIMAESAFLRTFPAQQGYGLLLVEAPPAHGRSRSSSAVEDALVDFGADARLTAERLDEYHRVENTYLSTFQTLGGLGLLLGTVGVAAVLLRNVLERRRELALLGAVGYGPRHFLADGVRGERDAGGRRAAGGRRVRVGGRGAGARGARRARADWRRRAAAAARRACHRARLGAGWPRGPRIGTPLLESLRSE